MHEECMVSLRFGSRGWSMVLIAGLVLASGQAWAATRVGPVASSPATTSATKGGVEVTVDSSVTNSATTRSWVEERAARALGALEHPLTPGDLIRIDVGGGPFDYRIAFTLLRQGVALSANDQPEEIACACGSDEMLETVAKSIEAGARTLAEATKREREEAAAAAERQRREEELQRQEAERKRQEAERTAGYRPSKLGRGGIGLIGVGGLVVITGGIIAAQGAQPASSAYAYSFRRDYSSPGRAVIGVGAAVVTAGITMLVVDAVRCRRSSNRCGTAAGAWMSRDAHLASKASRGAR